MLTQPKILVWESITSKKMPKTGFRSVADVYLKSCKKQNKGDKDLKYGSKLSPCCLLIN